MVNDIKGPGNLINTLTQKQSEHLKNQESAKGNKLQGTGEDKVDLNDHADKLKSLQASVESQPVVDTKRVEALRNAVLDGTYNVNAEATAEKMMAFETLLDKNIGEK